MILIFKGVNPLPKEKFVDPRKEFRSQRPETHEEWQARMGGEVLAVCAAGCIWTSLFGYGPLGPHACPG